MSTGFSINLAVSGSSPDFTWTPTVVRSNVSGSLTLASGQSVAIPWVGNSHTGTAGTTSANLKIAIEAGVAAVLNSFAASAVFA